MEDKTIFKETFISAMHPATRFAMEITTNKPLKFMSHVCINAY